MFKRSAFSIFNVKQPMVGPLPYVGGKNRLANQIISLLPEHITYVEPFAGGAQVLFHKTPSNVEVLNDLNYDIVNFFRVCQWHYEELIRYLRFCLSSRKLHELHVKSDPDTLTDVQRAGRFFYLQKNSFGGLVVNPKFHYGVTQPSNYNLERIPEILERTHRRLLRVQIECRPYGEILEKYDRPTTCFYLDPPYWGPQLYKFNFDPTEFERFEAQLASLEGKFLLSLNDRPEVRSLFAKYYMQECTIAYTAQHRPGKRYGELLIANYPLRKNSGQVEPQRSEPRQRSVG